MTKSRIECSDVVVRNLEEQVLQLEMQTRALREEIARRQQNEARLERALAETESDRAELLRTLVSHRKAEVRLRENEERLRLALSSASQGLYDVNVQTAEIIVNPEYARMLGYRPGEFRETKEAWIERMHPDDREEALRIFANFAANQVDHYRAEFRQRTKSGEWRWILSLGKAVEQDAAGTPVRILGTHTDITEQKQAEAALRESEAKYRVLIENAGEGIYVAQDGWIKFVNPRIEAIVGYTREEILSRPFSEFVHPEDRDEVLDRHAAEMQGIAFPLPIVRRIIHRSGQTRWVEYSATLIEWEGRRATLNFLSDITERKQTQEALRQSEQRLRTLVKMAPEAIFIVTNHYFAYANSAALRLFGAKRSEELLGQPVLDRFHPDFHADMREQMRLLNEEHRAVPSLDAVCLTLSGVPRHVSLSAVPFDFQNEHGVLVFTRDITERKQLEQERQAMEAKSRHQQKLESIGTLASGVAHEINNPLMGIMNYAQLLEDRLPPESPLTEFTGEIMRESRRVATIVRNLLTFSRNERQSHTPTRMMDVVEGTLSLIRAIIRHDDINLAVNVPEDLPLVECQLQQIQQVLMNLMTNARDALNTRYPGQDPDKVIHLKARVIDKRGRPWIRVTVEDHGCGISPEVRERMFDPFFTTKERDKGTGLGLAISHGIVKEHHGELTVETEAGRFTRMHMDLPACTLEEA